MHKHGLVHRDIKPSNIIFVQGRPKLADIGLVTDAGDARSIVGTEGYLAPEGPGSPQADLYSLGKVLYEISTGRDRRHFPDLPLDLQPRTPSSQLSVGSSALNVERSTSNAQRSTTEMRADHFQSEIGNPKSAITHGLLELNEILLKACARDPRQRYQSAEEMHADLALLQEGKSVRRARGNQRFWSQLKKVAFGLALLALGAAGVARLARQTQRSDASADGPPSTNELANALCAKALHIIRGDQYPAFAEAYTNFHQAIRLDPYFARPYVGLFELRMNDYVPALPAFTTDELGEIAKKLTKLAPRLAMTYSAQSVVAYCEPDYAKAKEYGLRATLADPDCAPARATYGWFLTTWGWPREGRKEIEVARRLRPSKSSYHQLLANTYYMERDFPKAIEMYREALRWESHREIPYQGIASASLAMGDTTTAISNLEQLRIVTGTHNAKIKTWFEDLRQAVAEQGSLGYWRKLATSYTKNPETNFYTQAQCQMHLGNTNDAFALLEKSFETHERTWILPVIYLLVIEPTWDGVRDHARFQKLLDRIGFTKVMPKRP